MITAVLERGVEPRLGRGLTTCCFGTAEPGRIHDQVDLEK